MVVWRTLVLRILEGKLRNSWGRRLMCYIYNDRHYYSIYAGWLGCVCRRVSSHDWQRSFPYEGRGTFCWLILFAESRKSRVCGDGNGHHRAKQIGAEPGTSQTTVKIRRHQVMEKMGVGSLPELVSMAGRLGILSQSRSCLYQGQLAVLSRRA